MYGPMTERVATLVNSHQTDDNPSPPLDETSAVPAQAVSMRFTYPSGSKPLDGYTIKRGIGIGGFGEVYFALSDAGKEVAIKRIQRNLDVELRGVSQCLNLKHINLISLWDIRRDDNGQGWVVMEYVPGHSLRDVIDSHSGGMPVALVKKLFSEIAAGVAYLHDHGIVHRDLKPGNIFQDADEKVVKIGDYGLAKFISCSRRSGQTESVGTFHYMAPEIGKGVYGKEIDVYALGIVLYEMLTGKVPFEGESSQEIIMKHLTAEPDLSGICKPYCHVIGKAMAKDPDHRYSSVHQMMAAIESPDAELSDNRLGADDGGGNSSASDKTILMDSDEFHVTDSQMGGTVMPPIQPFFIGDDEHLILHGDEGISMGEVREVVQAEVVPHAASVTSYESIAISSEEPIAKAVRGGWGKAIDWWNNANLSTPIKVVLLVAMGIIVVVTHAWLLPLGVGLGLFYLIYLGFRALILSPGRNRHGQPASRMVSHAATPDRKERASLELQALKGHLRAKSTLEKLTDLLGALIVATIVCSAIGFIGGAFGGSGFVNDVSIVSFFAWLTLASVIATWSILIANKIWEGHHAETMVRRLAMFGVGLFVGAIVFSVGVALRADFPETASHNDFLVVSPPSTLVSDEGIPTLPAYLVFFGGLFGILRWWKLADPLRKTRLSILAICICLFWAAILNQLWQFPMPWGMLLAATIAIAVQLASPWMHPDNRQQVCKNASAS